MKKILFLLLPLYLSACAGIPEAFSDLDMTKTAKIRVIHPGSDGIYIGYGDNCADIGALKNTSIDASISPVARLKKPKDLQIPKPKNIAGFYDEFLIPSDKNVWVEMRMISGGVINGTDKSCYPPTVSFRPQNGKFYEAKMSFTANKCYISINQVALSSDSSVEFIPEKVSVLNSCNKSNKDGVQ